MQLFAYRNTERSIHRKSQLSEGMQQLALHNAEQQARKEASWIIDEAKEEAARIVASAGVRADSMIAEAVTKVGKILGMAGMDMSENKQPVIDIIRVVATKHGVSVEAIKSTTRTAHVTEARHEAIALVYKLRPDLSLPVIGKIFGRDHTTVLYAVQKMGVHRAGHAQSSKKSGW